jgi:hypothetical protein
MVGTLESRILRIATTTPAPTAITAITAARRLRTVKLISIYELLIGAA